MCVDKFERKCMCVCVANESNKCWKRTLIFLPRTHTRTQQTGGFANLLSLLLCVWCVSVKVTANTVSKSMAIYLRIALLRLLFTRLILSIPFRLQFPFPFIFIPFFIPRSLFSLLLNAHVIASFQSKNHNLIYIHLNIPMYFCCCCCAITTLALCVGDWLNSLVLGIYVNACRIWNRCETNIIFDGNSI